MSRYSSMSAEEQTTRSRRSLFMEIPVLTSFSEENSSNSIHVFTNKQLNSPLPPLIVEIIPILNKHDDPDEFYKYLEKKIIKIYQRLFIADLSDASNISDITNTDTNSTRSESQKRGSFCDHSYTSDVYENIMTEIDARTQTVDSNVIHIDDAAIQTVDSNVIHIDAAIQTINSNVIQIDATTQTIDSSVIHIHTATQTNDAQKNDSESDVVEFIEVEPTETESAGIKSAEAESAEIETAEAESAGIESAEAESAGIDLNEAESAEIDFNEAELAGLESAKAESAGIQTAEAESAGIQSAEAESAGIETAEAESACIETAEAEAAGIETAEAESACIETAQIESAEADSAKIKSSEAESAGIESAGAESARIESAELGSDEERPFATEDHEDFEIDSSSVELEENDVSDIENTDELTAEEETQEIVMGYPCMGLAAGRALGKTLSDITEYTEEDESQIEEAMSPRVFISARRSLDTSVITGDSNDDQSNCNRDTESPNIEPVRSPGMSAGSASDKSANTTDVDYSSESHEIEVQRPRRICVSVGSASDKSATDIIDGKNKSNGNTESENIEPVRSPGMSAGSASDKSANTTDVDYSRESHEIEAQRPRRICVSVGSASDKSVAATVSEIESHIESFENVESEDIRAAKVPRMSVSAERTSDQSVATTVPDNDTHIELAEHVASQTVEVMRSPREYMSAGSIQNDPYNDSHHNITEVRERKGARIESKSTEESMQNIMECDEFIDFDAVPHSPILGNVARGSRRKRSRSPPSQNKRGRFTGLNKDVCVQTDFGNVNRRHCERLYLGIPRIFRLCSCKSTSHTRELDE